MSDRLVTSHRHLLACQRALATARRSGTRADVDHAIAVLAAARHDHYAARRYPSRLAPQQTEGRPHAH